MNVIDFQNVSKAYRLGQSRTSLREALASVPRQLLGRNGAQTADHRFWALSDVSFQVAPGEVLGIIGHNGAGKSTILKLLSKVTYPTSGHIRTQGRMAALIELGAGFHPDLSGRENVYLNGSILGLKRREIDAQFPEIVDFSELGEFIDTPVKRYSSGMYVRLAFAVAAHVRADVLLVDEVLSVGDMAFQRKCLAKMTAMRDSGATIVFVSHSMWSVSNFCNRALLLRKGKIELDGPTDQVIQRYRELDREDLLALAREPEGALHEAGSLRAKSGRQAAEAVITAIEVLDEQRQPATEFDPKGQMVVRCHYNLPEPIEDPMVVIRIRRVDGLLCCTVVNPRERARRISGVGTVEARIGPLHLLPDIYSVQLLIADRASTFVHMHASGVVFRVTGELLDEDSGVFEPNAEWVGL